MKHGMTGTKIYKVWKDIKDRCLNPRHHAYKYYGGKGITLQDEWRDNFLSFHNYISQLTNFGREDMRLNRIDLSKGYHPGNLEWSRHRTQMLKNASLVSTRSKEIRAPILAERLGIPVHTLKYRLKAGWTMTEIESIPAGGRRNDGKEKVTVNITARKQSNQYIIEITGVPLTATLKTSAGETATIRIEIDADIYKVKVTKKQ